MIKFGYEGVHSALYSGDQYKFSFENGYGASVIQHEYSYGGNEGLWELAVLDFAGDLTYDTEITDNVIGYLNEREVEELLNRIKSL